MLELEVGIWRFEGCVSFLGFPPPANPLAPKTGNPPRRQSDHAVGTHPDPHPRSVSKNSPFECSGSGSAVLAIESKIVGQVQLYAKL